MSTLSLPVDLGTPVETEQRCRKCGQPYPPIFFRQAGMRDSRARESRRQKVCVGCELTARTDRKIHNRPLEKARRCYESHATKFIARGIIATAADLKSRFGWDVHRMAHDLEHTYENTCPYCWQPFAEMEHGLADVTLDVIDPTAEPYYRTNVRWCCGTCNREKGTLPPAAWSLKMACWQRWRDRPPVATQLELF